MEIKSENSRQFIYPIIIDLFIFRYLYISKNRHIALYNISQYYYLFNLK